MVHIQVNKLFSQSCFHNPKTQTFKSIIGKCTCYKIKRTKKDSARSKLAVTKSVTSNIKSQWHLLCVCNCIYI